jgi:hypothetical protein
MRKPTLLALLASVLLACGGGAEEMPPAAAPTSALAIPAAQSPKVETTPAAATPAPARTAEAPPAPAANVPGYADSAAAVTKLLSGLKAKDLAAIEAAISQAIYPEVQWRRIPDKLGTLRSFELAPADETTHMVSAKMEFPASSVVFSFATKATEGKWRVSDFRMTEVVKAGVDGTLASRRGTEIKMQGKSGWLPEVGAEGEFSREIDAAVPFLGGGMVVIAKTRVTKIDGDTVTMEMLEERSKMTVNGKKLDHFTKGVHVRLAWGMKVPAP